MISKTDQQSLRQRVNKFISENVRAEYDNLMSCLKERVEERNANTGTLPKFVLRGSSVELGHTVLQLEFDQNFIDPDVYVLNLKVGWAPFRKPLFGTEPTPQGRRLRATASDDLSSILWVGDLGKLTSAELVEFALDLLTAYYSRHMPN